MSEPIVPDPTPGCGLILGGTAEARQLAALATATGLPVISSLAGRVSRPALPVGAVRIGGFGGAGGLAEFLRTHRIRAVVDATHPFAATMSANAATACTGNKIPILRLARPGWADRADAMNWQWVDSTQEAAAIVERLGRRTFLTTGRQTLSDFSKLDAQFVLVRVVEPPEAPLPAGWEVVQDRGPYSLAGELELMRSAAIEVLVTKNSGGSYTSAKLDAAKELGVAVVVVRRPIPNDMVAAVDSPAAALRWFADRLTAASL